MLASFERIKTNAFKLLQPSSKSLEGMGSYTNSECSLEHSCILSYCCWQLAELLKRHASFHWRSFHANHLFQCQPPYFDCSSVKHSIPFLSSNWQVQPLITMRHLIAKLHLITRLVTSYRLSLHSILARFLQHCLPIAISCFFAVYLLAKLFKDVLYPVLGYCWMRDQHHSKSCHYSSLHQHLLDQVLVCFAYFYAFFWCYVHRHWLHCLATDFAIYNLSYSFLSYWQFLLRLRSLLQSQCHTFNRLDWSLKSVLTLHNFAGLILWQL